ncbi:hypothetical protein [Polaribacter cellanae]|uniref:Glycosyltransferase n=1 Tax=Polaribacter cellanae TaxID=2818493 RepID=A0A975CPV7_9FLAO|nr:hypothetical protein [Polaribacter cellanae]QTE22520.1 hypothetical protein J3359_17270 [Polaribacter cellanae]
MKNILFIAKTNLNNDGRILNQIKILKERFPEIVIDFLLLEDSPTTISLGTNVKIYPISTLFRNNSLLRFLTVLEFTIKTLVKLIKIKPKQIHVQDSAVVLPILIYKYFKGSQLKLIYDDHEIPNENENFQYQIFSFLEVKLMKQSTLIIEANSERASVVSKIYGISKEKINYFLNLPYYENSQDSSTGISDATTRLISEIEIASKEKKIIMHQGSLEVERGREKLAAFAKKRLSNFKILIIGVNEKVFSDFIFEYNLDVNLFIYGGYVDYKDLNYVWEKVDASIIMYLPTYINNKLCAPNRFYISLKNNVPIIVNEDNPVLNKMVKEMNCGRFIEEIKSKDNLEKLFKISISENVLESLITSEKTKFIKYYENLL